MKFVLYSKRPSNTTISFLLATSDGLRNVPDGEKPLWRDVCIRRLQTTGLTSFLSKIHGEKELACERQLFLIAAVRSQAKKECKPNCSAKTVN